MGMIAAHEVELVGGRLCLDFVNTANWDGMAVVSDHVTGHDDLVRWGRHVGLLTEARASALASGAGDARAGARALDEVLVFRRACRALLMPGMAARPTAMALVQNALTGLGPGLRLGREAGRVVHAGPDAPAAWLMLPVAISAVELATSAARHAVGCCPGEHCGWLFLDRSRNRNRVWCSMQACGNRAKARAHYARAKGAGGKGKAGPA